MGLLRAAPAFVVLVALLAGCSQSGPASSSEDPGVDVHPTETTGIIKGVVVDSAIRPLPHATVTVKVGAKTLTNVTNALGGFGFGGLDPGTYFVVAGKTGYLTSQQSVDVVANDPDPRTVRIALELDGSFVKPYATLQKHVGYIECTTGILVLCGAPNLLTGQQLTPDAFTWDQYFADNASLIQTEMTWKSTQALSPELYLEMEALNGGCTTNALLNGSMGESPVMTRLWPAVIKANDIGSICPVYYSVFAGTIPGVPCGPPIGPINNNCVGVTIEQTFDVFMLDFHGFVPPTAYRYTHDGLPKPPP